MSSSDQTPRMLWRVQLNPFLIVSALLALAYGLCAPGLYAGNAAPLFLLAAFKATPILLLTAIAVLAGSRLAALALLFGAVGDGFLVFPATFLQGAVAFLIGHVFYIALFMRTGIGVGAALKQPKRVLAMLALVAVAAVSTSALVPRDTPLFVPLAIYTGVLAAMTLSSFTLAATRWLAMTGAVLFFISDGFVAWNMFHHDLDPALAFWRSFAGWMIYWAGQAGLCMGVLGLHKDPARP